MRSLAACPSDSQGVSPLASDIQSLHLAWTCHCCPRVTAIAMSDAAVALQPPVYFGIELHAKVPVQRQRVPLLCVTRATMAVSQHPPLPPSSQTPYRSPSFNYLGCLMLVSDTTHRCLPW